MIIVNNEISKIPADRQEFNHINRGQCLKAI
jgi:hypothetical protein